MCSLWAIVHGGFRFFFSTSLRSYFRVPPFDKTKPNKHTLYQTMLRLTVLAAAIACCSSFVVPPVALRSANRVETSKGLHMMTHREHSDVDEPYYPGEVAVDRRTLLKAIPATVVAGKTWHGTGRWGEGALQDFMLFQNLYDIRNFVTAEKDFAHVLLFCRCRRSLGRYWYRSTIGT